MLSPGTCITEDIGLVDKDVWKLSFVKDSSKLLGKRCITDLVSEELT